MALRTLYAGVYFSMAKAAGLLGRVTGDWAQRNIGMTCPIDAKNVMVRRPNGAAAAYNRCSEGYHL